LLVCSGTYEDAAYEDILGAGALVDRLWPSLDGVEVHDGARVARLVYQDAKSNLTEAMGKNARNGRRLMALPDLAADVEVCAREDDLKLVARLDGQGAIRRIGPT
jgi:phosphosulfolactate phosphohydrolase-like enzyme